MSAGGPTFGHGLVIGKFYPPHAGHHLLVRQAAARCRRVTVVVLASAVESIPLADRVAWLRAEHANDGDVTVVGDLDDHPIDYDDPVAWDAHVAIMAAAVVRGVLERGLPEAAARVDAVFTSEPYGDELARRFGAVSVPVDPGRRRAPVSGTAVRADLLGCWGHLAPPVRAGLARRVVVLGSESSGTTTLATALAGALAARGGPFAGTVWVPEYGRELTVRKLAGLEAQDLRRAPADDAADRAVTMTDLCWTHGDLVHVAERQTALIEEGAGAGSAVVVADTDAFATGVWCERYLGVRSAEVEAIAAAHPGDLYLLTAIEDVPFVDDGIRDGEHLRAWMQATFLDRLEAAGHPYHVLRGGPTDRLAEALRLVDADLAARRFADPLG